MKPPAATSKNGTIHHGPAAVQGDPDVWASFKHIIESEDGRKYQWAKLNQKRFIDEAKKVTENLKHKKRTNKNINLRQNWNGRSFFWLLKAMAIIQTGEPGLDSSLILTKGKIIPALDTKPEQKGRPR